MRAWGAGREAEADGTEEEEEEEEERGTCEWCIGESW